MKLKQSMCSTKLANESDASNVNDGVNTLPRIRLCIVDDEHDDLVERANSNLNLSRSNSSGASKRNHLTRRNAFANIWAFNDFK